MAVEHVLPPDHAPGPVVRPGREQLAEVLFTRRAHACRAGQRWADADPEVREDYLADADAVLTLLDYMPTEDEVREEVARELECEAFHWSGPVSTGLTMAAGIARRTGAEKPITTP